MCRITSLLEAPRSTRRSRVFLALAMIAVAVLSSGCGIPATGGEPALGKPSEPVTPDGPVIGASPQADPVSGSLPGSRPDGGVRVFLVDGGVEESWSTWVPVYIDAGRQAPDVRLIEYTVRVPPIVEHIGAVLGFDCGFGDVVATPSPAKLVVRAQDLSLPEDAPKRSVAFSYLLMPVFSPDTVGRRFRMELESVRVEDARGREIPSTAHGAEFEIRKMTAGSDVVAAAGRTSPAALRAR